MELKVLLKQIKELSEYLFEYDEMCMQINKIIEEGRISVSVGELILKLLEEHKDSAITIGATLELIVNYLEIIE